MYCNFAENEEIRNITFKEAVNLPLQAVKEKYLRDVLPLARGILRKDSRMDYGAVVSDEVEDEFLDNLLVLRWKENLKLWTLYFELTEEKVKEE